MRSTNSGATAMGIAKGGKGAYPSTPGQGFSTVCQEFPWSWRRLTRPLKLTPKRCFWSRSWQVGCAKRRLDDKIQVVKTLEISPERHKGDLLSTIGETLRAERRERGLTLKQVAEGAHVSVSYLAEIERGEKDPSSRVLESIAGGLDVEVRKVLERWITSSKKRLQRVEAGNEYPIYPRHQRFWKACGSGYILDHCCRHHPPDRSSRRSGRSTLSGSFVPGQFLRGDLGGDRHLSGTKLGLGFGSPGFGRSFRRVCDQPHDRVARVAGRGGVARAFGVTLHTSRGTFRGTLPDGFR